MELLVTSIPPLQSPPAAGHSVAARSHRRPFGPPPKRRCTDPRRSIKSLGLVGSMRAVNEFSFAKAFKIIQGHFGTSKDAVPLGVGQVGVWDLISCQWT